jgi:hypothetical protein
MEPIVARICFQLSHKNGLATMVTRLVHILHPSRKFEHPPYKNGSSYGLRLRETSAKDVGPSIVVVAMD